jgi:ribosomal-protein-alanine N-acetyltransferase
MFSPANKTPQRAKREKAKQLKKGTIRMNAYRTRRSPAMLPPSPPELTTARLLLRLPTSEDAPHILDFYVANREHFTPWWPRWAPDFFTERYWQERTAQDLENFAQDRAVRLYLFPLAEPRRVIGHIHFSQITRGSAHYCVLGYGLDREMEGQGLMAEGLRAAIRYMFEERNIHRIMANYIPHNRRSGALLKRLGFVVEGYARDYLYIDGQWQDHILTSLTNPDWQPSDPSRP